LISNKKKLAYIALALIFIGGAVLLFLESKNKGEIYSSKFEGAVMASVQKSLDRQMPNWEETLKNTTGSSSDNWQTPADKNTGASGSAELTETDKFAQDFFQKYLLLRNGRSDNEITDAEKQSLIVSMLTEAPFTEPIQSYKLLDLNIITSESKIAIKNYGNALGKIMVDNSIPKSEHELVIFEKAFNDDNPDELKNLDPIIGKYQDSLIELLKTPVPENAARSHLQLVTAMEFMVKSTSGFKLMFTDPIKALGYARFYPQSVNTFVDAYKKLRAYFISQNISFDKSESGFVFMNML